MGTGLGAGGGAKRPLTSAMCLHAFGAHTCPSGPPPGGLCQGQREGTCHQRSQSLPAQPRDARFSYQICSLYAQHWPTSGHPALEVPPWVTPGCLPPHRSYQTRGLGQGRARGEEGVVQASHAGEAGPAPLLEQIQGAGKFRASFCPETSPKYRERT